MTIQEWLGADNQLGIDIWEKKYRHNDESFDEWVKRVSGNNKDVMNLIYEKKFLFGGRILANRGCTQNTKLTYSNCYVITPPEDNIESIFKAAQKLARTYSYGGGCGIDIGQLRPEGAPVHNAARTSTGAVSFMELYNTTTGVIGQAGRRGALMISIPVEHPDVEKFITIKGNCDRITNANISIRVSNEFMEAVKKDGDFNLEFDGTVYKTVKAKELFHKICENNWNYAEPGLLFWDTIKNGNLLHKDPRFSYAGVNPCAEEPLPAGGSCLLGSLNLDAFVNKEKKEFDYDSFCHAVATAIKGLNEVLDEGLPLHPLKEQRESVSNWRQIGLGVMGIADMLIHLEIKYDSEQAIDICNKIAFGLMTTAVATSDCLGASNKYPMYNREAVNQSNILQKIKYHTFHLSNSQLLTIAPTGSLSTMLGISGGIEPIFANSYTRKTQSLHGHDEIYKVYTPIVKEYMDSHGLTDENQLPDFFVTAPEIAPSNRINMQAVWQQYIDASISSTINLPNEATIEDIEKIYLEAWEKGLKGVTIYRAGCAREGVLVKEEPKVEKKEYVAKRGDIYTVDDNVIGLKRKLQTGCGSLHVQAFFDPNDGTLQETYFSKGSTGGCNNFMIGLSRTISLLARAGVSIEDIVDQLNSTGACPSYASRTATKRDTSPGSCCPMAIGKALLEMSGQIQDWLWSKDETTLIKNRSNKTPKKVKINKCPQCGEELIQEGGCQICKNCGWSKCE